MVLSIRLVYSPKAAGASLDTKTTVFGGHGVLSVCSSDFGRAEAAAACLPACLPPASWGFFLGVWQTGHLTSAFQNFGLERRDCGTRKERRQ